MMENMNEEGRKKREERREKKKKLYFEAELERRLNLMPSHKQNRKIPKKKRWRELCWGSCLNCAINMKMTTLKAMFDSWSLFSSNK